MSMTFLRQGTVARNNFHCCFASYRLHQNPVSMKIGLLCFCLLSGLAARAQLLPVPNSKNPDWVLLKTEKQHADRPLSLPPSFDKMPNAAQESISSQGNHHFHWDANHQLAYDWVSADGATAPLETVTVREQRSDITYIYRRAKKIN